MIAILAIVLMIAVDQLVKYWAVTVLQALYTIPLIPGVFQLTYVENRGAAFGILQDQKWPLLIIAALVLGVMIWALRTHFIRTAFGRWSFYMIVAGALGNVIDRLFRGFVVDMFDFNLIHFPVFNVADICITVGGFFFVIYFLFQHEQTIAKEKEARGGTDDAEDHPISK